MMTDLCQYWDMIQFSKNIAEFPSMMAYARR